MSATYLEPTTSFGIESPLLLVLLLPLALVLVFVLVLVLVLET